MTHWWVRTVTVYWSWAWLHVCMRVRVWWRQRAVAHLGVTCDSGRFVGYDYIYSVVVTKTKKEQSGKYEPFNWFRELVILSFNASLYFVVFWFSDFLLKVYLKMHWLKLSIKYWVVIYVFVFLLIYLILWWVILGVLRLATDWEKHNWWLWLAH